MEITMQTPFIDAISRVHAHARNVFFTEPEDERYSTALLGLGMAVGDALRGCSYEDVKNAIESERVAVIAFVE